MKEKDLKLFGYLSEILWDLAYERKGTKEGVMFVQMSSALSEMSDVISKMKF